MPFRTFRILAVPVIGLSLLSLLSAATASEPAFRAEALRADSLLAAGRPDQAIAAILSAHAGGMSRDSLYWLLAEAARRKGALDTAMGFNLAVATPAPGPFRDSVLAQRFRLYAAAGLERDAASLRDSLPPALRAGKSRPMRLTARAGSGWFRESNGPAVAAPFRDTLAAYSDAGPEYRVAAGFEAPFARAGGAGWSAGIELEGAKSYAKDSLDMRLGLTLREEGWIAPGLSLSIGAGAGKITGSGWIASCKGEAAWLSFTADGISMLAAGAEAEWDEKGGRRYQTGWLAWYRDGSVRKGRGFAFWIGLSAFRSAPIVQETFDTVIYVDDARKTAPVHYTDSSYSEPISAGPITRYLQYTEPAHQGLRRVSSRAPQSFIALSPQVSYRIPLPAGFAAELSLSISGSWYPELYRRDDAPLPVGAPGADAVRRLALSRADGRLYGAVLNQVPGGMEERYSEQPLRRTARTRLEGRGSVQAGLRRAFGRYGSLSLAGTGKRYLSNLGEDAPVWIPIWDAGISLLWNGTWEW